MIALSFCLGVVVGVFVIVFALFICAEA